MAQHYPIHRTSEEDEEEKYMDDASERASGGDGFNVNVSFGRVNCFRIWTW